MGPAAGFSCVRMVSTTPATSPRAACRTCKKPAAMAARVEAGPTHTARARTMSVRSFRRAMARAPLAEVTATACQGRGTMGAWS